MNCSKQTITLSAVFFLGSLLARAQDRPIGYWESHLPYRTAIGVATDGSKLFTICPQPFYTFDPGSGQLEPYSKVNGMSDIGMQCVAYDQSTSTTVLVYADGNIDLFKDNTFYNIPDLKIKSLAGNKTVNQVYCEAGIAYLSTSVGILVIDLNTHNIEETYQFIINNQSIPIYGFVGCDSGFYAITGYGLYRAPKSSQQLQNFAIWKQLDSAKNYIYLATAQNTVFMGDQKSVYCWLHNKVNKIYTCPQGPEESFTVHNNRNPALSYVSSTIVETNDSTVIQHLDGGNKGVLISEFRPNAYSGDVRVLDTGFNFVDSCVNLGWPVQSAQLSDNSIWIADAYYGLSKRNQGNVHYPDGPADPSSFDIYAYNRNLWLVHGGIDDKLDAIQNYHCASNYKDGKWTYYERYLYQPFNDKSDACNVLKDEKTGTLYIGSFVFGLFILNPDGTSNWLNTNSIFDSSVALFGLGQRQVTGLALDASDNLWVTLAFAHEPLYVKTKDSVWYKFSVPGSLQGGPITIDDNGIAWYVNLSNGGVVAYNANGTFSNTSDDSYYHLYTGTGSGNLPSNNVHCIAKDKNNNIWIGTDNGIGIVSNCSFSPGQNVICDATIPIVQYDQFAGYLFAGNNVRAIAVDGANRKWVGTDDGIWLLSPNAEKIVYRYTTDNSPLPSNLIQKISIDAVSGDVYIGTDQGLVSFHSTATDTNSVTSNVTIFPNPVPKDYTGTIAIKGLALNSDVRITDINDQLVYKTTALGSQAVWNGRDYKGHKPQTGVYLVFASSADGSQTYAGKIVFMQ